MVGQPSKYELETANGLTAVRNFISEQMILSQL